MKEVVLDTETTGLSVSEGHRIVEIGCIELENVPNYYPQQFQLRMQRQILHIFLGISPN